MNEDWLRIIKDKLESYEAPLPDGMWERIEASLYPEKTRKVRYMPWVWSLAAAAAVALGVFFSVRLTDNGGLDGIKTNESLIAESPASPETNISSSADNGGGQASSSVPGPVRVIPAPKGTLLADAIIPDEPVAPDEPVVAEEVVTPAESVVPDSPTAPVEAKVDDKPADFKTDHDGEDWSGYMSATSDGSAAGVSSPSAGLSLTSSARESQSVSTFDAGSFFHGYSVADGSATRGENTIVTRTVSNTVSKDESHKRPVRMSLSLDFPLTKTFSVESGLTYSVLKSVFSTSSGGRVSDETQTLGYLGVPLNLKANLLDRSLFTVYTSGGGMVEKLVSSKASTDVDKKPLVWSVNAAAGLQINLPAKLGIYAEPGVSYHFDNGSQIKSVYTEHPFDFILTFGARYSFR